MRPGPDFDPTRNPYLSGRFAPVIEEIDAPDLEIRGELPSGLDGMFLRNGPNPRFTPIGSYLYPIDGDGMLHGVWLSSGKARYRNRFVRTPALVAEERAGRALWGGIESMILPREPDVPAPLVGTFRDLPDINVVRHAGRLLALAESACPFRMTPDLETIGRETFEGALPAGMTAHPKIDPTTGEMAVFCYALEPPFLTWSIVARDGTVARGPTPVPGVDEPVMIHDMALTARFLVLVLAPVFFDMEAAMAGGSMIAWRPERGTRVALIPRDGGPVRWAEDDAFWVWHTVNAHDVDPHGDVVLDYVQWDRLSLIDDPNAPRTPNTGGLTRAILNPAAGTMRRTRLDDVSVEFPRVDDRLIGRRHHRVALASRSGRIDLPHGEHDALRWYDTDRSDGPITATTWSDTDLSVGEPVYAPAGRDNGIDDDGPGTPAYGYWLTFAIDRTQDTSWLLVIPDEDPGSGPVARIRVPTRVPLGLHGNWTPTGPPET